MKEAAGEANLTVVAIILIGVIAAIVTPIISGMMTNAKERACCMDAGGRMSGGECTSAGNNLEYDAGYYQDCIDEVDR